MSSDRSARYRRRARTCRSRVRISRSARRQHSWPRAKRLRRSPCRASMMPAARIQQDRGHDQHLDEGVARRIDRSQRRMRSHVPVILPYCCTTSPSPASFSGPSACRRDRLPSAQRRRRAAGAIASEATPPRAVRCPACPTVASAERTMDDVDSVAVDLLGERDAGSTHPHEAAFLHAVTRSLVGSKISVSVTVERRDDISHRDRSRIPPTRDRRARRRDDDLRRSSPDEVVGTSEWSRPSLGVVWRWRRWHCGRRSGWRRREGTVSVGVTAGGGCRSRLRRRWCRRQDGSRTQATVTAGWIAAD